MHASAARRYSGRRDALIWFAIRPNSGGMTHVPTLADAIWTPISDCECAAPKRSGVACIIDG